MPAIFVSHSSLDNELASRIVAELDQLGFENVFLDFDVEQGIPVGENWEKKLYESLARCIAVILVLTPHWLKSTWCQIEFRQARALGKVLLPVVCAPLEDVRILPEIQSVDLVDWNAEGRERLHQRLLNIASELARWFTFPPGRPPYPGIHAFEAGDAAIYFGRDNETRDVIERLEGRRIQGGPRLLIVIGASGSGKSSLLRAGVLPQLIHRKSQWAPLPPMRPEKAPLEALAKSIALHLQAADAWRDWLGKLTGPKAIDELTELIRDVRIAERRAATVLLPIDQFEEVFTVTPAAERAPFLALLAELLSPARDLPFMVIATGRSDVLEGLINTAQLALRYETFPLLQMPIDRVPRLVEGPAKVAGLTVEDGLSERIKQDVTTSEALPLLAQTLALLHRHAGAAKQLTLVGYAALGDYTSRDPKDHLNPIQNSIRLAADQAIAGIASSHEDLAALRDAFVPHLVRVRLHDGQRVRQPALAADLPKKSLPLISALVTARLLIERTADDPDPAKPNPKVIEVAHEALFKTWPTLDRWLTEEHSFLADIERVRTAQAVWAETPDEKKLEGLLRGILLSRMRDWLLKFPQRFRSQDMKVLRAFVLSSVVADRRARAEITAQQERTRRLKGWLLRISSVAAAVFFVAAVFAGWLYLQAEEARQTAQAAQQQADKERKAAEDARVRADQDRRAAQAAEVRATRDRKVAIAREIYAISQAEESVNTECSLNLAINAYDAARGVADLDLLPFATSVRGTLARSRVVATLPASIATGQSLSGELFSWHPNGKDLAFIDDKVRVVIWSPDASTKLRILENIKDARGLQWDPAGERLAVVKEGAIEIWPSDGAAPIKTMPFEDDYLAGFRWAKDGKRALVWSHKGGTVLIDTASDKVENLTPRSDLWRGHAWSPDGTHVAIAARAREVWIIDVNERKFSRFTHPEPVRGVAWSPNQALVAVGLDSGRIWLWDLETGARKDTLDGHSNQIWDLDFSGDGERLASASWDQSIRIWDLRSLRSKERMTGHTAGLISAHWNSTGDRLASAAADGTVRIWSAKSGRSPETWLETLGWVWNVGWNRDGTMFGAASDKEVVVQIGIKRPQQLAKAETQIQGGTWSASGSLYAFIDDSGRLVVVDVVTRKIAFEKKIQSKHFFSVVLSSDGALVAVSSDAGILIFSTSDGNLVHRIPVFSPALAFSPQGRLLAYSPTGGTTVDVVNLETRKLQLSFGTLKADKSSWGLAWSRDGRRLAAASDDAIARVWDLSEPTKPLLLLRDHGGDVKGVGWNSTGDRLATASLDGTARIWDIPSGRMLAVLIGHVSGVRTVTWSNDGKTLATGGEDGTVRLFRANFPDILSIALQQTEVGLTPTERQRCLNRIEFGSVAVDTKAPTPP